MNAPLPGADPGSGPGLEPVVDPAAAPATKEHAKRVLRELALFIPNFAMLLKGLATDARVPRRSKVMLWVTAGYLILPIDIIPDFIPGIGQLDDVVLVALVLNGLINRVDPEVVRSHWRGSGDILRVVQFILKTAAALAPKRLRQVFGG